MQSLEYDLQHQQIYPKHFDQYLQSLFDATIKQTGRKIESRLLYLDVNYLYTFHPSDVPFIGKFTDQIRISGRWVIENGRKVFRNPKAIEWHEFLERWYAGEHVSIFNRKIKPIQIERTLDRVVNECMERLAQDMAGIGTLAPFKFHAIGDGAVAGSTPSPGDTALNSELDRINVLEDPGGGGMTADGSTFICIGNHDVFSPGGDITEMGMFDAELPGAGEDDVPVVDDKMGDHSVFPTAVQHLSGQDAPGGSIIIYQCSS
jgi:hypothetical protein